MSRSEPLRPKRGCFWCGHNGHVEPVRFDVPDVGRPSVCSVRCGNALEVWAGKAVSRADVLVWLMEREAMGDPTAGKRIAGLTGVRLLAAMGFAG